MHKHWIGLPLGLALIGGLVGCRSAPVSAQSFFGGSPIDGVHCDAVEGIAEHVHAHLQLFARGRKIAVPAMIGIPNGSGCLYWLHTHQDDGVIHIESPVKRPFTLGQFFDIWGSSLSWTHAAGAQAARSKRLSITIDGHPYRGRDPRTIVLRDRQEIVIQSGPPYGRPEKFDFGGM
ncbi:MAG: hypothetical protein M3Y21_06850 [Candidatus Eremiobacteraeota bacterium]|nr:hypothetical protein [Candidatus Eremiobacteraeota bacterium]